ncbi:hypothetical protein C8F01DRAFT_957503, partial [Mycena amicta]
CRTGHGYTGEYYSRFVPDESNHCPCGEDFQSRSHILRECPRYNNHRHILKKVSRDIALPVILGTTKGISALAKFLEESGAFTKMGQPRRENKLPTLEEEPEP